MARVLSEQIRVRVGTLARVREICEKTGLPVVEVIDRLCNYAFEHVQVSERHVVQYDISFDGEVSE